MRYYLGIDGFSGTGGEIRLYSRTNRTPFNAFNRDGTQREPYRHLIGVL